MAVKRDCEMWLLQTKICSEIDSKIDSEIDSEIGKFASIIGALLSQQQLVSYASMSREQGTHFDRPGDMAVASQRREICECQGCGHNYRDCEMWLLQTMICSEINSQIKSEIDSEIDTAQARDASRQPISRFGP